MTQEQEVADRLRARWEHFILPIDVRGTFWDAIAATLLSSREEGYRQGVEDAAKVASKSLSGPQITALTSGLGAILPATKVYEIAQDNIAAAILALTPSSALALSPSTPADGWQPTERPKTEGG